MCAVLKQEMSSVTHTDSFQSWLDKDFPHSGRVHPIGAGRDGLSSAEKSALLEATARLRVSSHSSHFLEEFS